MIPPTGSQEGTRADPPCGGEGRGTDPPGTGVCGGTSMVGGPAVAGTLGKAGGLIQSDMSAGRALRGSNGRDGRVMSLMGLDWSEPADVERTAVAALLPASLYAAFFAAWLGALTLKASGTTPCFAAAWIFTGASAEIGGQCILMGCEPQGTTGATPCGGARQLSCTAAR